MSKGVGRGRGWLNLEKKVQNPGATPSNAVDSLDDHPTTSTQTYTNIIHLLRQIDPKDDGILLNKKFKAFLEGWKAETKSYTQVEESFEYIYGQCLKDYELTKSFILVIGMFSFHKAEVHGVRIKKPLLQRLQTDFENRKELMVHSIEQFGNLFCMLSAVFNKGHFNKHGSLQKLLGSAVLDCLDMLLDSEYPIELELFTSQLWINISYLKQNNSEKLEDMLLRVRHVLIKKFELKQQPRIWLLLALDIANNHLTWQLSRLYSFYQDQLGEEAIAKLQEMYSVICNDRFVAPNDSEELASSFRNCTTFNNQLKCSNSNNEKLEVTNNIDISHERIGRPILGVGAQLKKNIKEANTVRKESSTFDIERR